MKLASQRFFATLLGALVAMVFVTYGYTQLVRNEATHTATTDLCEAINEQNAKQVELWEGIITLTADRPDPRFTPEERKAQLEQLRMLLDDIFAPQECP